MSSQCILHVVTADKFIPPYIDFISQNFDPEDHRFFVLHEDARYPIPASPRIATRSQFGTRVSALAAVSLEMHRAGKIILHGLFSQDLTRLLFLQPWLLRKCHWVIWGGDLYCHETPDRTLAWRIRELVRTPVIRRIGHLVTYIEGDAELARRWYGARGAYTECLAYTSNLYNDLPPADSPHRGTHIQIGNSADPSNNHLELLQALLKFRDEDIRIYAPLSYNNQTYADQISRIGADMFGDRFVPLRKFMSHPEYLAYLADIDIAVFNHRRQQAMGNIITLLGLGKTVYLRPDVSSWKTLADKGLRVLDVETLDLRRLDAGEAHGNITRVKQVFSRTALTNQWQQIFKD